MNSLAAIIAIAGYFFWQYPGQASFAPWKQSSLDLEKSAVAKAQRVLAQELDPQLPSLPFANWLKQVIGPEAGIVWQLGECGETAGASSKPADDIRACVEVNSILLDGRKVIVMIAVGTFKKGMTGAPTFHFGVIGRAEGRLYRVRHLRDLPREISAPGSLAKNPPVELPDVHSLQVKLMASNTPPTLPEGWAEGELGQVITSEDLPPPPEPPGRPGRPGRPGGRSASTVDSPENTTEGLKVLGSVSWGGVISKAQPRYPPGAKRYNISGPVDVQVTISATGRVTDAKTIEGHPLLRGAAEEAARQWVFNPATLKGVPVETQIVLTFVFKAPK